MNKILSTLVTPATSSLRKGLGIKTLSALAIASALSVNTYAVQPLTVSGNQVLAGGQHASFSGNSLFESCNGWGGDKFYNASVISWLKSDWKSNIVRAAMCVENSGGYIDDPVGNKAKVKAVVDAAIANDMYVIIDWHSHAAENYTAQSIAFFQEMARTYGGKPNVIYEVYNEPLNTTDWHYTIKPYAQQVVNAIRAIDPTNLIIVGTQTWSQDVDKASTDPISGSNIAYTLHFYAATHKQYLRDKAQTALNNGAALFVTEWGTVEASGDGAVDQGETYTWMDFLKQNNISNANWALNDKAEGSSALVGGASTTGGWTSNQLTTSGALVKSIMLSWPQYSGTSSSTSSSSSSSASGTGTQIEAESFVNMFGIQTEATTDTGGGLDVGYIDTGDWMTYNVNVPSAGSYLVSYRVASLNGGGVISLEKAGGSPQYGTINVPGTGGWQTWVTITHVVTLPAGQQTIGLSAKAGGFNINWFRIDPVSTSSASSSSNSSSSSSSSVAPLVTVQAENYAIMSGVQTETTSDIGGGLDVGYIDTGDWMSYTNNSVNIPTSGTYTVEFRVASAVGGGSLSFEEAGGSPSYASLAIPNTGGWQNWTTVKTTVTLNAGTHNFGLKALTGGWNINWFRITPGIQ